MIKDKYFSFLIAALLVASASFCQVKKTTTARQPNIIYILTDDLGYGDIGVFFQNERARKNDRSEPATSTPNLDKMAAEGAMLMQHYCAAPVCAPSRASTITGLSQGHANIRDNQFDKALSDGYTVGNVLQKAGYATAVIGKWGLQGDSRWDADGEKWLGYPLNRGFDYFYGYVRHSDGHEHYPKEGIYRGHKEVYENRNEISDQLDKCYTGDLWTGAAKKWITTHEQMKPSQPFFMYLAYDIPHAVLELPTQAYPAGGGLKGGIQYTGKTGQMLNTATGKPDSWTHPDYANATYDDDNNTATPEVPWPDMYKRYATSVRRIDDAIGDLSKLLTDLKIDDNTLIIFTSDNGPSIESYLPAPSDDYAANFFNSFGPFDGIKRDVLEGGERMPAIARWPNHIPANSKINTPNISYDWLPTFTAAAGLPAPACVDGVSLLPVLTGKGKQQENLIYVEYFQAGKTPGYTEFAKKNRNRVRKQMQMIRMGDLIGLRYDIKTADDDFEIYNALTDLQQANNLGKTPGMASLQTQMKEKVLQVRRVSDSTERPYDGAAVPASHVTKSSKGLHWQVYKNAYSWLPNTSTLLPVASGVNIQTVFQKQKGTGKNIIALDGYINVPQDGEYTFYLVADGKVFIRLHEAILLDADYNYKPGSLVQTTIKLQAGMHAIKITYADTGIAPDLQWEGPGLKRSVIGANQFSH